MGATRQYGLTEAQMQAIADESYAKARRLKDRRSKTSVSSKGGSPPDVIARLAAQLAGQLQSAAGQSVQAVAATASNPADTTQTAIAVGRKLRQRQPLVRSRMVSPRIGTRRRSFNARITRPSRTVWVRSWIQKRTTFFPNSKRSSGKHDNLKESSNRGADPWCLTHLMKHPKIGSSPLSKSVQIRSR